MSDQDFTFARLERLWALDHPEVTWRHDVDYDVRCAALMALDEERAGIRSYYYIRLRAPDYNIFNRETRRYIDVIHSCGQSIGLHFDHLLPRESKLPPDDNQIKRDARTLRDEIPYSTLDWTAHAPPHTWPRPKNYVADSRGVFRASPEDALLAEVPIVVNLHPEWWYLPEPNRTILFNREQAAP